MDFIEKTINIIRFKSTFIYEHRNEVQQASKDLNEQIDELEVVIAILVNLDIPVKEGLPLEKLKEKWNNRFEEVMQKKEDGDDLLLDRLMDIKDEVKAAKRELIKLKDMQEFTSIELKRIKFEDDWVDGPNIDILQQVFTSYDEYLLE